jgi:predicted AlkP superfamily pyrophosphatase or phosphodiesterase
VDTLKRAAALIVVLALAGGVFFYARGRDPKAPNEKDPDGSSPAWLTASCELPADHLRRIVAGTYEGRSPDLQFVPAEPHMFGMFDMATHSGPWDYLQEVPLVFYGPGYIKSQGDLTLDRPATVADIAPTFAELLGTSLPEDRPGVSISEALEPVENRTEPPRMIVLVVWDGGGWNVLNRWPDAWPTLERLMADGTSVQEVEVGSSPSVTPAVHMTMGAGTFPDAHGIIDIPIRTGDRVVNAFPKKSPKFMAVETLADLYDPTTDNRSKIGVMAERAWHMGMMGHGAYIEGGDKDINVLTHGALPGDTFTTNTDYYRLPAYLEDVPGFETDVQEVDISDGSDDGLWMGHELQVEKEAGVTNPVWTRYQLRVLETLWEREGFGQDSVPDLFFTNFKEIDLVGHGYNMLDPEMRSTLEHTDDILEQLVDDLDAQVGAGRWVLAMTADHGQGPYPRSIDAWPIEMEELQRDIAREVGINDPGQLYQGQRPIGMWFNPRTMARAGISLDEIADFLLGYTIADNVIDGRNVPGAYRDRVDEKLFAAAFPTSRLAEVVACSKGQA